MSLNFLECQEVRNQSAVRMYRGRAATSRYNGRKDTRQLKEVAAWGKGEEQKDRCAKNQGKDRYTGRQWEMAS